jgi:hypothetical protein
MGVVEGPPQLKTYEAIIVAAAEGSAVAAD